MRTHQSYARHMSMERIDFIDAYCDYWCERCRFTMRCAGFDRHVAIAMCDGDADAAFELALPRPDPVQVEGKEPPAWRVQLLEHQPTDSEIAETSRQLEARNRRVRESELSKSSSDYMIASHRWFEAHEERVRSGADPIVVEALEVVHWDSSLISAKLYRAMSGREDFRDGEDVEESPVQNDWNGSAKVAILSLTRSTAAWRVIATATADSGAAALGKSAARLLEMTRAEFPRAMDFVRPGFDEPCR